MRNTGEWVISIVRKENFLDGKVVQNSSGKIVPRVFSSSLFKKERNHLSN